MKQLLFVVACLIAPLSATTAAADEVYTFRLRWMLSIKGDHPTKLPSIDATGGLRSLRIEPIVDSRGRGSQVGDNPDRKTQILTDSDVPAFVHDALLSQFRLAGLDADAKRGEATLRIELLQFWATGDRSYRADVRVRCNLEDTSGNELWSGVAGGVGENWGLRLRANNYNETFSNAVFDLAVSLLQQEPFINALRRGVPR